MHIYPLLGLVCYHSMFPVGAFLTVFRNDWVSGKLLNLVQQIAQTTVPAITEFHSLTNHPSSSNSGRVRGFSSTKCISSFLQPILRNSSATSVVKVRPSSPPGRSSRNPCWYLCRLYDVDHNTRHTGPGNCRSQPK